MVISRIYQFLKGMPKQPSKQTKVLFIFYKCKILGFANFLKNGQFNAMNLCEFNQLPLQQKAQFTWDNGNFLTNRVDEFGRRINLYHSENFFVEVYYSPKMNAIISGPLRIKLELGEPQMKEFWHKQLVPGKNLDITPFHGGERQQKIHAR